MADIEISLDVEVNAGVHFWVDRDEWNTMSDERKREKINDVMNAIAIQLANDSIPFDAGRMSAELIGPTETEIDLSKVDVYDPDE